MGKRTHGLDGTKECNSWRAMRSRCLPQYTHAQYKNYGGRGITPCEGIVDSVTKFVEVMGKRPQNHSLDRIDNNKGYYCGDCEQCTHNGWSLNMRWADRKTQNTNKGMYANNKTGYKGVYKSYRKYYVAIRIDKKLKYLGSYSTPEQANAFLIKYRGG